ANFRQAGLIGESRRAWQGEAGPSAVLSGSCSRATRAQVARHRQHHPALEISADGVMSGEVTAQSVAEWMLAAGGVPLAFTSADPAEVARIQKAHGRAESAAALEALFAETARLLVAGGITRLITAGGETSGAVVEGLGLAEMEIGPEIDPGVPAMRVPGLAFALKSGNFGQEDFFEKAARVLA
ncbi:MAG: nucleotide-binding domain containing protein, partial [Pseudomonadota bacterium]